jgi:hypothetical protein
MLLYCIVVYNCTLYNSPYGNITLCYVNKGTESELLYISQHASGLCHSPPLSQGRASPLVDCPTLFSIHFTSTIKFWRPHTRLALEPPHGELTIPIGLKAFLICRQRKYFVFVTNFQNVPELNAQCVHIADQLFYVGWSCSTKCIQMCLDLMTSLFKQAFKG